MYDYGAQRGTMPVGGSACGGHFARFLLQWCWPQISWAPKRANLNPPNLERFLLLVPTSTILKLLPQRHDLDQQLPVWDRATLLSRQAEMVSRLRPDLGRDWANELFTLSSQTKWEDQRLFMQNHAMGMLTRLDPDRALEVLNSMNIQRPSAWAASAPEMQLVQAVFGFCLPAMESGHCPCWSRKPSAWAPRGHYPYAALGYAAMQTALQDRVLSPLHKTRRMNCTTCCDVDLAKLFHLPR
jgi:hypothetical protein